VKVCFVFENQNLLKVTRLKQTCHLKRSDFPPFSDRLFAAETDIRPGKLTVI
jgi:hypothetical protein